MLLEGAILNSMCAVTGAELNCKGNLVPVYLIILPTFTFCFVCKNTDIIHTELGDLVKSNLLPMKGHY